jgi:hypothetical protein
MATTWPRLQRLDQAQLVFGCGARKHIDIDYPFDQFVIVHARQFRARSAHPDPDLLILSSRAIASAVLA